MALFTCPECKREISDTAISCPSCGYALPGAQKVVSQVRTSKITQTKKNPLLGVILIALGVVGSLGSLLIMPLGIVFLIGSVVILIIGAGACSGAVKVYCPYCGKPGAHS
jgi:DNA-directed RNA polymerase subunit RPC12/RpoP